MGHHILYTSKNQNLASSKYGLLYNQYVIADSRNIAPIGWHAPTETEFTTLETAIGGNANAAKLMSILMQNIANTVPEPFWQYDSAHQGTDDYGFNALPGGERYGSQGTFSTLHTSWSIWGATLLGDALARFRSIQNAYLYGNGSVHYRYYGKSVKLIKDNSTDTGTMTGTDNRIYKTVKIGNQVWMAENYKSEKYRNGDWIAGFEGGIYTPITNANWVSRGTAGEALVCAYNDDLTLV